MEQTNNKTLVIYHKEDADGLVSAAIVYCYLNGLTTDKIIAGYDHNYMIDDIVDDINDKVAEQINNNINTDFKFIGTTYAELSDMLLKNGGTSKLVKHWHEDYNRIIMVDISFNETDVMYSLYKEYGTNFYWFDHHKPIINASYNDKKPFYNIQGFRDTNTSTLMLVYHYFYGIIKLDSLQQSMEGANILLRALAGYDSWQPEKHNLKVENEFNYAMTITRGFEYMTKLSLPLVVFYISYAIAEDLSKQLHYYNENINFNDKAFSVKVGKFYTYYNTENCITIKEIIKYGEIIINNNNILWENAVKQFGDRTFNINGEETCVLFMQTGCNSTVFSFLKSSNTKHVAVFKRIPTANSKKQWNISLYNVNDDDNLNIGKYLKDKYNGGGHCGAGGCTISQSQFNKIMVSHEI